jgi:hypothetical protein
MLKSIKQNADNSDVKVNIVQQKLENIQQKLENFRKIVQDIVRKDKKHKYSNVNINVKQCCYDRTFVIENLETTDKEEFQKEMKKYLDSIKVYDVKFSFGRSFGKKRVSRKRVSRKRVSRKRVSRKRVSRKRVSRKRVSRKRVSRKRVSRKRVSRKRVSRKRIRRRS